MEREILHVDVNNAFLSWLAVYKLECGEKLDIRTIPSIIGGDEKQRHGIVLAKSNLAKQFGIKTGEPLYSARKKCPTIKIYESNFKVYRKYSDMLYKLLLEYSYKVERFSIDECFVDMTEFLNGRRLIDVAYEISKRVKEELKFTVNIGVAHNKLLAKMASDFQKPDRVHTLYEKEIPRKMWTLPIYELFMVGRRTLPKLYNTNIKTIEDLAKVDKNLLIKKFGKFGKTMWEYANGIDESEVVYTYQKPKCVGNSTTVSQDINDIEKIEEEIEHRKLVIRKEAIEAVKEARAQGDLSENFEYYAAKKHKNQNESRIRYLERMLKTATVVDDSSKSDEVGMDDIVEVEFEEDGEVEKYKLVTSIRGNSMENRVSIESPIGKALKGHRVGDRVLVNVNENVSYYLRVKSIDKTGDEGENIRSF